jgi:hypothetical protein
MTEMIVELKIIGHERKLLHNAPIDVQKLH